MSEPEPEEPDKAHLYYRPHRCPTCDISHKGFVIER